MPPTGREYVRKLQKDGWIIDRIQGSHYMLKKGSKTVTVPVHSGKELPVGLLHALKKKTGIS